uniref:Uncharacterized protein n=1 Tax=Glossina brevipalpis TaxID=37001 RepID=A0A1A9WH66_9MUSC
MLSEIAGIQGPSFIDQALKWNSDMKFVKKLKLNKSKFNLFRGTPSLRLKTSTIRSLPDPTPTVI